MTGLFVVGLTGGIGSGKSAAAERFSACGAALVDADGIAHELTAAGGAGIAPVRAAFGASAIGADGGLDRPAMRRKAFADTGVRKRLEAILHPLIRAECETRLCRLASADFPYAVLVVPLLVESGDYRTRADRICVVDCPEEVQVLRVMQRNGLARDEVMAIVAAQARRAERLAVADDVIDNGCGLEALDVQVVALHARYLALAAVRSGAKCS